MSIENIKKWLSERSPAWRLNMRNVVQGLYTAIGASVAGVVLVMVQSGTYPQTSEDWQKIKTAAICGLVGYLIKKFPQGEK
jgi:hypothetical protein